MGDPVIRVSGGVKEAVSLFLVEHRGVLSIVDTGSAGSAKRVLAALEKAGRKPEDVRQIVLTHCHGDHAGEAKALKEATDAIVVAGADDVGVIEGIAEYPRPVDRIMRAVYEGLTKFPRLPVDRPVTEREHLDGGLIALPSPGHTAGHIAIQAPDLDTIFVGDLVWHIGPLRPSWRRLTQDRESNRDSIRRIAALDAARIVPGHGAPVSGQRLSELAAKLGR